MADDKAQFLKTFPYFALWQDNGDELPCSGTEHGRTLDEVKVLAETRVLHGGFDSYAAIYKGDASGSASLILEARWVDRKIIFQERKRR